MKLEEFRPVVGHEGIYEISNHGRIRSISRRVFANNGNSRLTITKFLRQDTGKRGYKRVGLYKNKIKKGFLVHRLVALAFIPQVKGKIYINHIDEITDNNNVDNLEWCTNLENIRHGTGIIRAGFNRGIANGVNINQLNMNGELFNTHASMMVAESHGFRHGNIVSVCNGSRPHYKGYKWEYAFSYKRLIK